MLVYQTYQVATDLELPLRAMFEDGVDLKSYFEQAATLAEDAGRLLDRSGNFDGQTAEEFLNFNRQLRSYYAKHSAKIIKSFEQQYCPLGGWKMYFG